MLAFDKDTQVRILRVAGDRADGKSIEALDQRIAYIMDLHPEYDEIWKQGELATYPQEINGQVVNPFVHTVLHAIVDKQIQNGDPDFVVETYNRLMGEGMDEHDCLHVIIGIYAELYFSNFRKGSQFDYLDYSSRLSQISFQANSEDQE